jgi:hypothetical protein
MFRPQAAASIAMLLGGFVSACDALIGEVEVGPRTSTEPVPLTGAGGTSSLPPFISSPPGAAAGSSAVAPPPSEGVVVEPSFDAGADAADVAVGVPDAEAPAPPILPRPVLVDGPAATLELVGVEGGEPHLGLCEQGFVIGVRPTANPSEEVFGQRLTFVEPICGTAVFDAVGGALRVSRDDSILRWDGSGEFLGPPPTEVPDERLTWVLQPETSCPEAAPVLVGLSGAIDPVAPDGADTVVIRSLVIECAPLVVGPNGVDVTTDAAGHQLIARADSFAASGAESYNSACGGGSVITQLVLHAGFWLDGFVLGCSSLRSPLPGGEPCAEARECQTDVCSAEGSCSF